LRIQIAQIAAELLQDRKHRFLVDASLPASVRSMISVHLAKPWIQNFWTVAIRSQRKDRDRYFDFPIGFAEDGTSWFFPSRLWWLTHAQVAHPPAGVGVDVEGHTLAQGIDYAAVLSNGRLDVAARDHFVEECRWWSFAFPPVPATD